MTFLHKLAKRLALIPTVALLISQLVASCSQGSSQDYLGPDPSKPNPSGSYIGLSVTPHDPQLVQGDSIRLQARGWLSSGLSSLASVSWSAAGGMVSGDGWYRATSPGAFRVRAVSTANAALSDSVTIVVIPPGGIARLDITPSAAPLPAGTKQQFTAVALMGDGSRMYPTVSWSATGGTISSTGLFTAGIPGAYTITASTIDGALLGRTQGIVGAPALLWLSLDPAAPMMESGATTQFLPYASWSDGSTSVPQLIWTATGGAVTSSGVYTAGTTPGSFRVIASSALGKADTANVTILPRTLAIRLSPLTALLALEATQVVTAYAIRNDGTEVPVGVQWSAEGGTISLDGTYSAGLIPGTYAVAGTLNTPDGRVLSDTAQFQVGADEATAAPIIVKPDTSVGAGARVQFTASSGGGSTVPAVTWSATGGSIDGQGLYTAGTSTGSFRVIGKRKNSTKADTATVIIQPAPVVTVSGFTITPQSDIIASGQSRQFSATLSWSDGGVHPYNISWVSAGGTITQNGFYTAGALAGTYLVIATCGCGAADTASVTIPATTAPVATLSQLVLSPPTVQLVPGASQSFTVAGVWSDGASSPPQVTFVATGGTITPAGGYVAGSLAGTYRVIATQTGGTLADTSVVTIQAAGATLTQLVLNPSSATVPVGATQAFVVSASWSDGSSTVPPVTFTATGGSVSPAGVYTAGTIAGSYKLIAAHTGGTKADTSVIIIPSGVTLTQVVLSPSTVSLAPSETKQFVVTGLWSDGSSLAPSVTYTATGGTISAGGLYSAGSTAGTYRVIAVQSAGTKADTSAITISGSATPPPPSTVRMPELPRAYLNTTYQRPSGTVRRVALGGDLQAALNAAQCGDRILLAAGATYTGAYTLPNKNCSTWIEISTETALPPEGTRVTPASAASFARIVTPGSNQPALVAAVGAGFYRIMGVIFEAVPTATALGSIVQFHQSTLTSVSQLAHDIVLDRVVIQGHDALQLRRCLLLNAVRAAVVDSYLSKCHYKGSDAQAVLFWDTPGPIKVSNNFLEGSGENLMIGGADPSLSGMVPSDIEISHNHFYKPMAWKTSGAWTVKNLLELKLGKRVLIEGNVFENTWPDGQVGFALLLKSVNQSGNAPWSETSDVMIRNNIVRNAGHGINIAAKPEQYPVIPLSRVAIVNNLFYDLNQAAGPQGMMTDGETADVTILNNTVVGSTAHGLLLHGAKVAGTLSMRNNIVEAWIKSADGLGYGSAGLDGHLLQWEVLGNAFVISTASVVSAHPLNNMYPSTMAGVGFVDLAGDNYRLSAGSTLRGKGTDGRDPGADIDALLAATAGVIVP